jgi:6-pyruvoyltetrahydropterin/6-carboxytetrahydropterin synthase
MYEVGVARTFEGAHQLEESPSADEDHEHNYRVEAVIRGEVLGEQGMLLDLDDLGAALDACTRELESAQLESLPAFEGQNTTVEVVAQHVWDHVRELIGPPLHLESLRVTVLESADAWAAVDQVLSS